MNFSLATNYPTREINAMTSSWSAEQLRTLHVGQNNVLPAISPAANLRMLPESYLWDFWPVMAMAGGIATVDGAELWMSLSAPSIIAPDERHHVARIRLLARKDGIWKDCGLIFPDGFSLGSHEWTGSATLDTSSGELQLFYTAAGRNGFTGPNYEQRLAQVRGRLLKGAHGPCFSDWENHRESVVADGQVYAVADQVEGEPGFIRAFRDPYFFQDPADDRRYLVFTASVGRPLTPYSGAVGIAEASERPGGTWQLRPPLLEADGVNNELERAHVITHGGLYYLFWSTQSHTFHPDCRGPNGLYGAVSETLMGAYEPLNGSGLVLTNPEESPAQCYAWQVLDDLSVVSFINSIRRRNAPESGQATNEEIFVGSMAPRVRLHLEGDQAYLAQGT
ncbi:MAG: glycoside hydrolase family 68 protein [Gammaproteobacteria bacterium]|nr:glycoside hydrolase family 68 protein [Gammaproteobacteria bacterium]